ncbi:hypothetical protein [Moorena sp. SIO3A2]|uniref:hypothetical protein n=1 Tax=Moorena sp. SIO3A2 TaxID=2607841 RepID=UPI0013B7F105|nr:hypothetical protein [Moorena sp. SIO3A2]NER90325.1 hypothetical protein [Moorena sp. SIO3A2]
MVYTSARNKTLVVEFKQGMLSANDVSECGINRGYFQLSLERFQENLEGVIFVGEAVSNAATNLINKIQTHYDLLSQDTSNPRIKIRAATYSQFVENIIKAFVQWIQEGQDIESMEAKQVLLTCHSFNPLWFEHSKLIKSFNSVEYGEKLKF